MRIAMRHLSCGRAVNVLCHGIHSILQALITTQYLNYKYLWCDCLIAMARTCNMVNCDEATVVQDSRDGEANTIIEEYECANGHTFHETLEL